MFIRSVNLQAFLQNRSQCLSGFHSIKQAYTHPKGYGNQSLHTSILPSLTIRKNDLSLKYEIHKQQTKWDMKNIEKNRMKSFSSCPPNILEDIDDDNDHEHIYSSDYNENHNTRNENSFHQKQLQQQQHESMNEYINGNSKTTNDDIYIERTQTSKRSRPRLDALRKALEHSSDYIYDSKKTITFQDAKHMKSSSKQTKHKSTPTATLPPQTDVKELLTFLRQQEQNYTKIQQQQQQQYPLPNSHDSSIATSEMLTDKYKRFHSYLRISLSERCNFRCLYCMPPEGVPLQPKEDLLTTDEIIKLTTMFSDGGVDKIRLTGGEPLLHPNISTIISSLSSLPKVRSVGITTNGLTLSRQLPQLLSSGLTHVNISLDTLQEDKFLEITRRNAFRKVMKAIDDAAASSIGTFPNIFSNHKTPMQTAHTSTGRVKVNCVVMKGFNDNELRDFVMLTKYKNVDVRFIEWMPFQENGWNKDRFFSYKDMLTKIQTDTLDDSHPNHQQQQRIGPITMNRISDGPNDTTKWYHVPNHKGRIGFITSMSEHFCATCNRLRITADGKLKVCLFGAKEVSLRDIMRMDDTTDEDLVRVINATVKDKTWSLGGYGGADGIAKANSNRPMTLIGG